MPPTMNCIEIASPGGPELLKLSSRPIPSPGPGEVLIEVHAAGVNRPDVLQRKGLYPAPPGASDIPGLEVAGVVTELGEGVTTWTEGDHVCALIAGGGYAEACVAHESHCLPMPDDFSFVQAAAMPETYFTVWSNVFDRGRLAPGETLLVQGGSSGIGTTAIQMARAFDHRVFATAGSPEKCAACEKLGAERAINYRTEDLVGVIKGATQDRGVDVILDMVAGDTLPKEIQALADDGRIVLIAFLGGAKATLDFGVVMRRRISITGSTLRARDVEFKASVARSLRDRVWPLRIAPVIHATFPLADASRAHTLMESGVHIGKIVLTVG
jgi:NADPH:quinone reductase